MFKKTSILAISLLIVIAMLVVGCAPATPEDTESPSVVEPDTSTREAITLSTGSSGGMFYILGSGIATVLDRNIDNLSVVAVTPANINEVPFRVNSGENVLGLGLLCLGSMAKEGLYEYEGRETPNINHIAYLFDIGMSVVTVEGSGINEFADIKGRDVGISSVLNTRMLGGLLREAGIDPDEDINWVFMSYAEQAEALKDGTLDIGYFATIPKSGTVEELAVSRDIVYIYPPQDVLDAYAEKYPYWKPILTPANTYPNQDEETWGPGFYSSLDVYSEADEDLVYRITKTLFESTDDLVEIHPAGSNVTPENTIAAMEDGRFKIDDMHPGAIKYLREIGLIK